MARKATKEIKIRVPEDLHQRLAALSMESGNSITSLVKEFILAGLTSSKGVGKTLPRSEGKQESRLKEKIGETFVRLGKMKKKMWKKSFECSETSIALADDSERSRWKWGYWIRKRLIII